MHIPFDSKNDIFIYFISLLFYFFHYRKNAIDKAKSMTSHIAYPDELLDDNKLNAFYENVINSIIRPN